MASGNFSVSRKIWAHPEFKPAAFSEREAFLWLVSEASWKARTVRAGRVVVDLKRGQLCASLRFMADAWQWPKSNVDRFLKRLKKRDMIGTEGGTGQLVITLCNYDEYQPKPQNNGTDAGQKAGHERDTSGTNYNKDEIKGEEINTLPNGSDGQAVNGFSEPVDFASEVFSRGVAFLSRKGTPEKQARAFIGKLRKDHSDTDIFQAFDRCSRAGAIDPIPWITKALQKPPERVIAPRIDTSKLNPDGSYRYDT